MNNKNIFLCSIIFLGFFLRLYTLIPNFTPVFSMCMFSGMMFEKSKKMFLVPLLAMFATDMILGIHNTIFFVYFALLIVIYIGYLNTSKSSLKVLIPSIFVSNISLITFIGTIIMGLFKFDIIFVVFSVSSVMIGMHLLYDSIRRRYDILSKKNENFSKIKPVLDYSVMALILYKIIS